MTLGDIIARTEDAPLPDNPPEEEQVCGGLEFVSEEHMSYIEGLRVLKTELIFAYFGI